MKALTCPVILTSATTRADGSLGIRFSTPELKSEEKVALFELQGMEVDMLLQPRGEVSAKCEVKGELQRKSQSERIRDTLFVWYKQLGEPGEWETFYRHETEKIIDGIKKHLKPEGIM